MRNKLNPYLLITLVLLFSGVSWSQTTYPASWENLIKTTFTSPNLQRQNSMSGTATATSENLLYGADQNLGIRGDGFLIYTPANNNQSKKLGFSITASEKAEITNTIDYGFSFLSNGKVKAYTSDESSAAVDYSANQQLKILRQEESMSYFVNGVLILQVKVDMTETLMLRAELTSNNSSFNDVRVSFDTKRLIVDPIINNVNSTIKMVITGGFSPFEYAWEDGHILRFPDPQNKETNLSKGLHSVKIRDAHGVFTERAFLMGNDVSWTNFHSTQQNTNILNKTSGNNWGDARSTATLGKNDLFWVQYIADVQQVSKAFGISFTTTSIASYSNLEAGFLLLKENQLQIIYQGNIILTTEYNNRDALLLSREGKKMVWMINGKKVHEESNINFTLDLKITGLLKEGGATLKAVNFYNLAVTPLSTTWNDSQLTGSIQAKITYLTNSSGPFHYYISEEPIPPLYEIYKFVRDSIFSDTIDGGLDSLLFFEGNASQLAIDASMQIKTNQLSLLKEHSFENLENGDYYVTVFDKTGFPIHSGQIRLAPALTMYNTDGIIQNVQTSVFTSTKTNAKTDLNYYIDDQLVESKLDFQIINTSEKYDLGLADFDVTESTIKYGFTLNKDNSKKVNFIVNGMVQTTTYNIKKNNILSLEKNNGNLDYKINGITKFSTPLTGEYLYKGQLLLSKTTSLAVDVEVVPAKKQTVKLYKFSSIIQNGTCANNTTSLTFKISKKGSQNGIIFSYTLTSLIPHSTVPYSAEDINSGSSTSAFTGIPFGVYQLSANSNTNNPQIHVNETIYIGIEGQFDPVEHYDLSPNSYSLKRNDNPDNNYAYASSLNTLKSNETGFVSFTPLSPSKLNVNYFSFNSDYNSALPNGTYVKIYKTSTTLFRYDFYSNGQYSFTTTLPLNTRISAQINATTIQFFANVDEILGPIIVRPTGDLHIKAMTLKINNGFKDILFSFSCKSSNIYPKVEKTLTGVKYKTKFNTFNFSFYEEYNDLDHLLEYSIYDTKTKHVYINQVTQPLNCEHGDNRETVNVTILPVGAYILEVKNQKNELFYLRFIKE